MLRKTFTIYEGTVGLHFVDGRLDGLLSPGSYKFWGRSHKVHPVSIQPQFEIVGGQDALTSDGGTFRVSVGIESRLVDPLLAYRQGILSIAYDSLSSLNVTHIPTQLGIRDWVTSRTFQEAFENKEKLHTDISNSIRAKLAEVGYELLSTYLIDMTPTGGLKAAMADLLKADLEGKVSLARARNEAATMRSLMNTARLVRENPRLLELRILATGQKPRVTFVVGQDTASAVSEVQAED